MLSFEKAKAPECLTAWQATPDATWESVDGTCKEVIRSALHRDQRFLCAYCQRRIETEGQPAHVEHWIPQSVGTPEDSMRWTNLLGVCAGTIGNVRHCDASRGNAKLFLHPVQGQGRPDPRQFLRYTGDGGVRSSNECAQNDIRLLNLDADHLRRGRARALKTLGLRLGAAEWKAGPVRRALAALDAGKEAPPFVEVVRAFLLQRLERMPH